MPLVVVTSGADVMPDAESAVFGEDLARIVADAFSAYDENISNYDVEVRFREPDERDVHAPAFAVEITATYSAARSEYRLEIVASIVEQIKNLTYFDLQEHQRPAFVWLILPEAHIISFF